MQQLMATVDSIDSKRKLIDANLKSMIDLSELLEQSQTNFLALEQEQLKKVAMLEKAT